MTEYDEKEYEERILDDIDTEDYESIRATTNDLAYQMAIRNPTAEKMYDYLTKDVSGSNLDSYDKTIALTLFRRLIAYKALIDNGINVKTAYLRTHEKLNQLFVTSLGSNGFLQKIMVTRNINRTGEYSQFEDKPRGIAAFRSGKRGRV